MSVNITSLIPLPKVYIQLFSILIISKVSLLHQSMSLACLRIYALKPYCRIATHHSSFHCLFGFSSGFPKALFPDKNGFYSIHRDFCSN